MPSMSLLFVGTASVMDMPHSVPLRQGHQLMPRAWCMGPVSANTIPVVSTVSSVRTSIMTFPGILLRTAILMPVGSVSAMDTLRAATLTWLHTWRLEM